MLDLSARFWWGRVGGEGESPFPIALNVLATQIEIQMQPAIMYVPASMAYPAPFAETDDHNEASVMATESLQRFGKGFTEAPPSLPFFCWDHKLSIYIFWSFILAEVCFVPESFYYGLTIGTSLNHSACKSSLVHIVHSFLTCPFHSIRNHNIRVWLRQRL